jgi:hypothetical protein
MLEHDRLSVQRDILLYRRLDNDAADFRDCGFQCIAATCYDLIAARLPI